MISCNNLDEKSADNILKEKEKKEVPLIKAEDTISKSVIEKEDWKYNWGFEREDGRFLKYVCKGENMFIEYGNRNFKKIMNDTFPCTDPYVGIPRLWWDNKDFICLRFGCGSPCWGAKILPLMEKDTVQTYMYQYGHDENRNVFI